MEFLEQGSVGDGAAVLLYGLPELLLCRVAIHRADLEPAICIHPSNHSSMDWPASVHSAIINLTRVTTPVDKVCDH